MMNSPNENLDETEVHPEVHEVVNENGFTAEQQTDYDAFCEVHPEYDPNQPIRTADRHFGAPKEKNTFFRGFDRENEGYTNLGDMNLHANYNDWLPVGCTLDDAQQQKLFLSTASVLVKTMHHLNKKNLEQLKSETTFLLGCNNTKLMKTFLKRVIHDEVRALISGAIKRLPVKDEFLIYIDEDGRPALKWLEMSEYKLHRLIDLLIVNIQGTSVTTFLCPLKEATGYGLNFMAKFKDTSLCDHTINPMRTTQVIAEAKNSFSENNMRMHKWIKVKENSMAVVFNIFTDLRDSTKPSYKRERNELIMRLFVMNGMVSNQFPTVPSTLEYFPFINMCEDILTELAEAYRAVRLWAHPALNSALNMSE